MTLNQVRGSQDGGYFNHFLKCDDFDPKASYDWELMARLSRHIVWGTICDDPWMWLFIDGARFEGAVARDARRAQRLINYYQSFGRSFSIKVVEQNQAPALVSLINRTAPPSMLGAKVRLRQWMRQGGLQGAPDDVKMLERLRHSGDPWYISILNDDATFRWDHNSAG
jgi:hypothetical protein